MSNLHAIWKKSSFKTPSLSTKNSLAPEHRTLQLNLGNENINLHKALNWISSHTEISSVKTTLDTSTLTPLQLTPLEKTLKTLFSTLMATKYSVLGN